MTFGAFTVSPPVAARLGWALAVHARIAPVIECWATSEENRAMARELLDAQLEDDVRDALLSDINAYLDRLGADRGPPREQVLDEHRQLTTPQLLKMAGHWQAEERPAKTKPEGVAGTFLARAMVAAGYKVAPVSAERARTTCPGAAKGEHAHAGGALLFAPSPRDPAGGFYCRMCKRSASKLLAELPPAAIAKALIGQHGDDVAERIAIDTAGEG